MTQYQKTNNPIKKWEKDLNVRPESIKLLEEKKGRTLHDINQSNILYDPPPRGINKSKNKQMRLNQTNKLWHSKGNHKQNKDNLQNGRKYLQMMQPTRDSFPKYRNSSQNSNQKTTQLDFPGGPVVQNLPAKAGDTGSIPGLGRSRMSWDN